MTEPAAGRAAGTVLAPEEGTGGFGLSRTALLRENCGMCGKIPAGAFVVLLGMAALAAPVAARSLEARATEFAGAPVTIDPRIALPPCADAADLRWHEVGRSVEARCDGFAMVLPVAGVGRSGGTGSSAGPVVVKRGDPVLISAAGSGYRVVLEARAEANGRAGERIRARNVKSGEIVLADVGEGGALTLAATARPAAPGR